jgi:hypothetical protein
MAAYQDALDQPHTAIGIGRSKPGSVAAAVAAYFLSQQFAHFAPSTQVALRSTLNRFRDKYGEHPLGSMPPKFIALMLQNLKPGVGRNWFKHIRALCQFAVSVEMIESDPIGLMPRSRSSRPRTRLARRLGWDSRLVSTRCSGLAT